MSRLDSEPCSRASKQASKQAGKRAITWTLCGTVINSPGNPGTQSPTHRGHKHQVTWDTVTRLPTHLGPLGRAHRLTWDTVTNAGKRVAFPLCPCRPALDSRLSPMPCSSARRSCWAPPRQGTVPSGPAGTDAGRQARQGRTGQGRARQGQGQGRGASCSGNGKGKAEQP